MTIHFATSKNLAFLIQAPKQTQIQVRSYMIEVLFIMVPTLDLMMK